MDSRENLRLRIPGATLGTTADDQRPLPQAAFALQQLGFLAPLRGGDVRSGHDLPGLILHRGIGDQSWAWADGFRKLPSHRAVLTSLGPPVKRRIGRVEQHAPFSYGHGLDYRRRTVSEDPAAGMWQ